MKGICLHRLGKLFSGCLKIIDTNKIQVKCRFSNIPDEGCKCCWYFYKGKDGDINE